MIKGWENNHQNSVESFFECYRAQEQLFGIEKGTL